MASEIAAWLTANASEFFDRIETITDNGIHVYCFIDDVRAVDINTGSSGASSVSIKNGKYVDGGFYSTGWLYGVKTSKGIAVYHSGHYCIMVTKSNEGTVSLATKDTSTYACADFDKSSDFVKFNQPTKVSSSWIQSGKTVLAPIVNANALTYADGLYLQVSSQYPNVDGIFTINGKQYYTDGVLALEE
jgi:hypothetical protein